MARECEVCSKGRYQAAFGAVNCIDCTAGRYQPREQMAFCDACAEGYWSDLGQSRCLRCAEGYWYRGYYEAVATYAAQDTTIDSQYTNDNDVEVVGDVDDNDNNEFLRSESEPGCVSCGVPKKTGAYCGGGLCLPVPQRGFWSQGVDSSSDDFNIVGTYIYVCRSNGCKGAPTLDQGCYTDWHIESYPDLTNEHRRLRLDQEILIGRTLLTVNDTTNVTVYDGIGRTVVSEPSDNASICSPGAWGPLCQACEDGWFFDAAETVTCQECESSSMFASLPSFMAMVGLVMLIKYRGIIPLPKVVKKVLRLKKDPQVPFVAALSMIPPGQLKVIWSTIQIVQAISTNLELSFPEPMLSFNLGTSVLNLDFLSVDCTSPDANFHSNVYTISAFPIVLLGLLCLSYWAERGMHSWKVNRGVFFTVEEERAVQKGLYDKYAARALTTTYLFLPTATMAQFKGMTCFSYEASTQSYLKADSSIDCNGAEHQSFIIYNFIMIIFYQSIILFYFYVLYSNYHKINPMYRVDGDVKAALRLRDLDHSIDHIRFLFHDTSVKCWYHEVFDMYRRMFFIGILPLTSEVPTVKATIGAGVTMFMTIYFREMLPSRNPLTNLLSVVSQYQILFVFLCALFILSSAIKKVNVSEFALGCLLVIANIIVVVGSIYAGWLAHRRNLKRMNRRKRKATKIEYAIISDDGMFDASTLERIAETSIAQSFVLAYHYTSMAAAKYYVKNGIPAYNMNHHLCWSAGREHECRGVVFSLKGPNEIKRSDPCLKKMSPLSSCREAVLCVAVPREVLCPIIHRTSYKMEGEKSAAGQIVDPMANIQQDMFEKRDETMAKAPQMEAVSHLVVIPCEVSIAFSRSGLGEKEIKSLMEGWGLKGNHMKANEAKVHPLTTKSDFDSSRQKHGDIMIAAEEGIMGQGKEGNSLQDDNSLPVPGLNGIPKIPPVVLSRHSIVKAYQLTPDADLAKNQFVALTELVCPELISHLASFSSQYDSRKMRNAVHNSTSHKARTPIELKTCKEYLGRMAEVRDECDKCGLVPMYYYTKPRTANIIAHYGFPHSTTSSKDSGIHFTALSPASYDVGSYEYEDNLILDMLGHDGLVESQGAHKFDVCIVYAAEPRVLRQAPGRLNAVKMVPKLFLEHFSEPESRSGDYLLRPDRIVACFLLAPSNRLKGYDDSLAGLIAEKEKDKSLISKLELMESAARFNYSIVKEERGQIGGQEPWPHTDMISPPADFGPVAGTPSLEAGVNNGSTKILHRSSSTIKSEHQNKSKATTEHKQLHEDNDLGELTAFLAPAGLENFVPRFASVGLLKKQQLLALDHEVYCMGL